jgi:hypothetical protein
MALILGVRESLHPANRSLSGLAYIGGCRSCVLAIDANVVMTTSGMPVAQDRVVRRPKFRA